MTDSLVSILLLLGGFFSLLFFIVAWVTERFLAPWIYFFLVVSFSTFLFGVVRIVETTSAL